MANAKYSYFHKESCDKTFHPEWPWQKKETDHPCKAVCLVPKFLSFDWCGYSNSQKLRKVSSMFNKSLENQVDTL